MKQGCLVFLLALIALGPVYAAPGDALTADQEARAVALGEQLRCVVCQSEAINDSQAGMARDMRLLVREKIAAGWSDAQIFDFMRARYGDFILLNPPLQANTYLLWALPAAFLAGAAGLVSVLFRKRKETPRGG